MTFVVIGSFVVVAIGSYIVIAGFVWQLSPAIWPALSDDFHEFERGVVTALWPFIPVYLLTVGPWMLGRSLFRAGAAIVARHQQAREERRIPRAVVRPSAGRSTCNDERSPRG